MTSGAAAVPNSDGRSREAESLICHIGFAVDGRPWVVPTAFARLGGHLDLHGAVGNFALRTLAAGADTW